jgi:hypothetical protein
LQRDGHAISLNGNYSFTIIDDETDIAKIELIRNILYLIIYMDSTHMFTFIGFSDDFEEQRFFCLTKICNQTIWCHIRYATKLYIKKKEMPQI